jgi:hypothetical protein
VKPRMRSLRSHICFLAPLATVFLTHAAAAQPAADRSAAVLQERAENLAAFWRSGPLAMGEVAATTSMLLAVALVVLALGGTAADGTTRRGLDRETGKWLAGGAAVFAWSFFVRFVLATPNILTDGGSGYGRVMRYVEGYGGVAVLVKLLPATWSAFMWRAMLVPRLLAALAPALLVWVVRGLGFGPAVGLLAGLALASVPVHAALTASDHLEGSMSSLQLAGLALVLAARRAERSDLFAAGVALAAWAMWVRPEGALGLLPIAAASLAFPRRWWARREVIAVVVGLALLVLLRVVAMVTSPTIATSGSPGSLGTIAWGSVLFSTVLVPVWLWAPAPFAVAALRRRRALAVAIAGLAAGLIPPYLRGLFPDPANTHLELLRYGTPAFPWLALASAVSLDAGCRWLAGRWSGGAWHLVTLRALLALVVASPVALDREYLSRRYGHAASEAAIRRLLTQVPEGCGLLVPDDRPEGVSIEIAERYVSIAAEAYAEGAVRAIEVLPVSDFLDGKLDASRCWTFLRGPYCYHAYAGRPAEACTQLESRFNLEEIASIPIEFRHHRLVTGPDVRRAPWYIERMPIMLYRILGRRGPNQP